MRIVLCPDKFRGTAGATEVSRSLARGIRRARADRAVEVVEIPIADGGEGTIDALVHAGWSRHRTAAHGPTGTAITADIATRDTRAVVELAQASGRDLVATPAPRTASTYGTGELMRAALDAGCRDIVLTLGGSATNDAGAGLLAALGAGLYDAHARPVPAGGTGLAALARIDLTTLDERLAATRITVATDVENPLLGPQGAIEVFAAQKGAEPADREALERALTRFAQVLTAVAGHDHRDDPGAGAAGGAGFGVLAGLGASRTSGVGFVLVETGVEQALAGSDLVVVGEGRLDAQSLAGKAPVGVARLARRHGVPVVAVAGEVTLAADELRRHGIDRAYSLTDRAGTTDRARTQVRSLLEAAGAELFTDLLRHRPQAAHYRRRDEGGGA